MSKCGLCFSVTGHKADYALTFGKDERVLKVCRYCREDLALLRFNVNQIVRLVKPLRSRIARFWFVGLLNE